MESNNNKRSKGNMGEDIACFFLKRQGFDVLDRNYQKRWGELDIVATKRGEFAKFHFIEVKTVYFYDSFARLDLSVDSISKEQGLDTSKEPHKEILQMQPEENVHGLKKQKLRRMVETYLNEKTGSNETSFEFHVLLVYMNKKTRKARVKWMKNIIL